jgi:hypothetical protein
VSRGLVCLRRTSSTSYFVSVASPLMPYTYYATSLQEGFGGKRQFTMPKEDNEWRHSTAETAALRASVRRTATRQQEKKNRNSTKTRQSILLNGSVGLVVAIT